MSKPALDKKVLSLLGSEEAGRAWFKTCASAFRWTEDFPKDVFLHAIRLQFDQLVQNLLKGSFSADIPNCIHEGAIIATETGNTDTLKSLLDKTDSVDLWQLLEVAAKGGPYGYHQLHHSPNGCQHN